MVICKLLKDGKELEVIGIDFKNQYVVYYDETPMLMLNSPLYSMYEFYQQLPLSQAKLKFIVGGQDDGISIVKA
jgi:hypothetical protein